MQAFLGDAWKTEIYRHFVKICTLTPFPDPILPISSPRDFISSMCCAVVWYFLSNFMVRLNPCSMCFGKSGKKMAQRGSLPVNQGRVLRTIEIKMVYFPEMARKSCSKISGCDFFRCF
jgi:hypothetical protein